MSDRTANIVIGIVSTMWVANILAGMFQLNGYSPSESINGIFMTVVGGAFIARTASKNRNGNGDGDS